MVACPQVHPTKAGRNPPRLPCLGWGTALACPSTSHPRKSDKMRIPSWLEVQDAPERCSPGHGCSPTETSTQSGRHISHTDCVSRRKQARRFTQTLAQRHRREPPHFIAPQWAGCAAPQPHRAIRAIPDVLAFFQTPSPCTSRHTSTSCSVTGLGRGRVRS